MSNMRKRFEAGFKARVGLEALKGEKTMAELSSEYGVHASQISKWKQELQKGVVQVFSGKKDIALLNQEELVEKLYRNVGELKVENDWLKKKLNLLM
jgi:transposase-like protein